MRYGVFTPLGVVVSDHPLSSLWASFPYLPDTPRIRPSNPRIRRKNWLDENGPCRSCVGTDDLQVDHIDPSTKVCHRVWTWSEERRSTELAKCQVLCRSCHLKKTAKENSVIRKAKPIINGKLNKEQVIAIYHLLIEDVPARVIAQTYKIHHSTVIDIQKGRSWANITNALKEGVADESPPFVS